MGVIYKPVLHFAFLFFLGKKGNNAKILNGNDTAFEQFLQTEMLNYTTWLQENNLDPSPQTDSKMTGDWQGVFLDCELSNHYMSGQSMTDVRETPRSSSNFTEHCFSMGRVFRSPLHFYGNFVCSGYLSPTHFPIPKNLRFTGQGSFHIISNSSTEGLTMVNVGITQERKLDLSHSWTEYYLNIGLRTYQLEATWNETLISEEYLADVEKGFEMVYNLYVFMDDNQITFPAGLLLKRYVMEVAQAVDLTEVLDGEDLPDPVVPTPTPSTTTSTRRTSTTTTTETPNCGQMTFGGLTLLYTINVLTFFVHVPNW